MTAIESRPLQVVAPSANGHANGNGNGHAPGRVPPHSLRAEADLLGALLLSRQAIDDTTSLIRPDDFYKPAHAHIYNAILELHTAGEPVDMATVADHLTRQGLFEQCGGFPALAEMTGDVPAISNAARYAKIIGDYALLRRLITAGSEIVELGYSTPETVSAAVDQAEQMLHQLADSHTGAATAERLADAAARWAEIFDQRFTNGPDGVPTGLTDLDKILGGGYRPGRLYFVAARPAMGKSLIGVQTAHHVAANHNTPALVVSAEMPTDELMDRLVASQARIDGQRIRTGELHDADWTKISTALGRFGDTPLWIYDRPEVTIAEIRSQVRRIRTAEHRPVGLVVVDYLQLLASTTKSENRQLEVDTLARGLKVLSRSLEVPVVAMCQVNRNVEARSDKRPQLSDLRESGGIEAHGDAVIALYRDEVYNPDTADQGTAELIVLKQRGGPIGTVKVTYLGSYGIFADMARN